MVGDEEESTTVLSEWEEREKGRIECVGLDLMMLAKHGKARPEGAVTPIGK